jgi:hypothetical protein
VLGAGLRGWKWMAEELRKQMFPPASTAFHPNHIICRLWHKIVSNQWARKHQEAESSLLFQPKSS